MRITMPPSKQHLDNAHATPSQWAPAADSIL